MCASLAPPEYFSPPEIKKKARRALVCKNIVIEGRRTSVRLDPIMWSSLSEICKRQNASIHHICTAIAQQKLEEMSLSNAIRVFIVSYFRAAATEEGHAKCGHGHDMVMSPLQVLVQDTLA